MVGDRLRSALGTRSIRWLSQELTGRGLRGASYNSVHGYVTGKRSPPLEVIEGAAEVLGVGYAWLATGRVDATVTPAGFELGSSMGVPEPRYSPLDHSMKDSAHLRAPVPEAGTGARVWEVALNEADPIFAALDARHRMALVELLQQGFSVRGVEPTMKQIKDAGKALAAALRLPADLTGTAEPTDTLDAWSLARYVEVFVAAMRLGVPRIQAGGKGRAGRKRKST